MDNAVDGIGSGELRRLVAQIVRETVAGIATQEFASMGRSGPGQQPAAPSVQPTGPITAAGRTRTEQVRITGDSDLQQFAFRLLALFESPKTREDIRAGRLRFQLAGGVASAASGAVERIESGAVTERRVAAAAASGASLLLGKAAVLTPLAREKARALGVPVEKERR